MQSGILAYSRGYSARYEDWTLGTYATLAGCMLQVQHVPEHILDKVSERIRVRPSISSALLPTTV